MTAVAAIGVVDIVAVLLALAIGVGGGVALVRNRRRPQTVRRILMPFTGRTISRRALDAAIRLALAENATLMPAYLARSPLQLSLDAPLPRQAAGALPLLEAIEQRASDQGVPVDSRIECGRTYRHALLRLLESESFDRVVVPATAVGEAGFSPQDLAWLLERASAEIVILRPASDDHRVISANGWRPGFRPTRAAKRSAGEAPNGAQPASV